MDANVQRVIDESDIRRVLALYTRGIDRLDAELVYDEASTDDHGVYKGPGKEFGPYIVEALSQHAVATSHNLHQSIIDVHHEAARAETWFTAHHVRQEADGQYLDTFGGRYMDKLKKRSGRWTIVRRVVVRDWSMSQKIEGSYYSPDAFENGKRSREDLAYQAL
jgi:hypothetical protein